MTSLQKVFVLAAALVLALTVGGGAGFAQDGEIVGIEYSFYDPSSSHARPITRFNIDRAVGSAAGVTVDLAADTVRLGPGKYWIQCPTTIHYSSNNMFSVREIPAVSGQDSIGTTVEIIGKVLTTVRLTPAEFLVVVNGDGATQDDVKLGTVGRRVDFSMSGGMAPRGKDILFIRRLGD